VAEFFDARQMFAYRTVSCHYIVNYYYYHLFASGSAYIINNVINLNCCLKTAENTSNKQQLKFYKLYKLCKNMRVNVT